MYYASSEALQAIAAFPLETRRRKSELRVLQQYGDELAIDDLVELTQSAARMFETKNCTSSLTSRSGGNRIEQVSGNYGKTWAVLKARIQRQDCASQQQSKHPFVSPLVVPAGKGDSTSAAAFAYNRFDGACSCTKEKKGRRSERCTSGPPRPSSKRFSGGG